MQIETWPVERLKVYEKNARRIPQSAIDAVAKSIAEFGWRQPIVVDEAGVIVIGHVRRLAALQLKLTEVPVHVARGLSPEKIRALRLMDNRSHDEAQWDPEVLTAEMLELRGLDLDLSMTGFEKWMGAPDGDGVIPGWGGMPELNQEDLDAWQTVKVHFRNAEDRERFADLVEQPLTDKTRFVWFPKGEITRYVDKAWTTSEGINPRYPIYIVSKGRWESRLTSKALEEMQVPYRIVVEPQEFDSYADVIDRGKILTLPFSNLGLGSIPARNWIWEHALSEGYARHWIVDDNIKGFFRLNDNLKVPVKTGATFAAAEDFVDRYENVALSGFQYFLFTPRKTEVPVLNLNTRIYSCILIDNSIPYRWRGRYNEDTDLSLCALKDGWCTVLFNTFLAYKMPTMTVKGGNTEELYQGDGRLHMAQSLQLQHPDVVTIKKKWGRWQHQVDYRPFKANKFIPKPGFVEPTEANEYGMHLEYRPQEQPVVTTG